MPATPIDFQDSRDSASVILDTRRTRPRFFDGKFLTAADLTQEQSYLLTRQADLGRTLGFGVAEGLRVTLATRSASDLPHPAASVTITRGHGLTPAGDLVLLPRDLTVDLDNVATLQRLSAAFGLTRAPQQPFQNLSGLFVLGLRAVEFTANPTPAYPPSVDGNGALRDGEVIEATALVLVPYDSDASRRDARSARARAAREIFLEQKSPPLPAGVLPLAMLWLRHGQLSWVDEWLVRREAGDDDRFGFGFAPRALSEAHFFHYQEMLREAPSAGAGQLVAQSFVEILPPAGPLPASILNPADFTQAFFPPEARVELALVPEDELAALMEDGIDLPPIDLSLKPGDQDALAILILAPVKRSAYGEVLGQLKTTIPEVRHESPRLRGQSKPVDDLRRLNADFKRRDQPALTPEPVPGNFADPAWREVLTKTTTFWFIRRRNLPDGQGLAGTPLRATTPAEPTDVERPTPNGVVVGRASTRRDAPTPRTDGSEPEANLAKVLESEGLWGRFAFLRAISDAPTHAALVQLLGNSIVLNSPLLQQAIVAALEHELPSMAASPEENFARIQEHAGSKALTPAMVATVGEKLAHTDVVQGLELAARDHPKLLSDPKLRQVLGRTNRLGELAQLGRQYRDRADFAKLMETIEKHAAAAGGVRPISDAIDRFLKKVNA
ncbi:MAG: hypothetical protein ACYDC1_05840 [Limisphaerales bacterium]